MQRRRWLALGVLALMVTTAAAVAHEQAKVPPIVAGGDTPKGLEFRLSEGRPPLGDSGTTPPLARTTPLSDVEADRVLARLAAIGARPDDTQGFALRESSLPPPRAGQTISTSFPPPPTDSLPPAVESGPLTVRRVQPVGDVLLADRVSITFSQPMVPVTSQEEAAARVPVTLTPEVPGTWRWLGTQTLIFDAGSGKRLPMATRYRVTVPAGTKSETGGTLAQAQTVEFETPAVRLLNRWPGYGQPQPRDPAIPLVFDQRVDPDAVLKTTVLDGGGRRYGLRRASDAEIRSDKDRESQGSDGNSYRYGTPADRVVVLKPVEPLPTGTHFTVNVGPGTPSLEGPRTTDTAQNLAFETYSPLEVVATYGDGQPPGSGLTVMFNNSLDEDSFDPATVKVTPAVPGVQITGNGNSISVSGATKGRATYTVTVPAGLKDTFGQVLGKPETRTFHTGPATPQARGSSRSFVVCDPAAKPRAVFQSVNTPSLRFKLFIVTPTDWPAFLKYQNRGRADRDIPPGQLISDRIVPLKTPKDAWGETGVDVGAGLTNGRGNVVVQWESTIRRRPDEEPDRGSFWMQATSMGLMAQTDGTDFYGWVTDLATGKPVADAAVELVSAAPRSARTSGDGMARITLGSAPAKIMVVRRGSETAFLPSTQWQWDDSAWVKRARADSRQWFIFDDRKLYRPGETAHIKGWVRVQQIGQSGDLTLPIGMRNVSWTLNDARGNEVRKGVAGVNGWAGFDFSIELPKTMNLGQAQLRVDGIGHELDIQEFRRPEFEVSAKNESAGPHVVGDPKGADLSVTAKYYAGGALPNSAVNWTVSASPTTYSPPGHEGFTFGKWVPWWGSFGGVEDSDAGFGVSRFHGGMYGRQTVPSQQLAGRTAGDGSHHLHLDFDSVHPAQPYVVSAQAVLQDVNRQAIAANTSLIVHPSERYVGLKGKDLFVTKGAALSIDALVCDIDGKTDVGRPIQFHAARKTWVYAKGKWRESEADVQDWTARSETRAVTTAFTPRAGGTWTVRATVVDDRGRPNESELTLWVAGGDDNGPHDKQRGLGEESVNLIPNRQEYKAGQTATILVQSPFANAQGLATVVHDGIVGIERFTMKGSTYTLRVPIAETFLPAVGVQVELVGSAARTGDDGKAIPGIAPRPSFASGHLDLRVPPTTRRLTVTAVPDQAALPPGSKTNVTVAVRDADGKPVANAEAAVVVVDESVLALAGWNLGDPLAAFYSGRETSVETRHLREAVVLEDPAAVTGLVSVGAFRPDRLNAAYSVAAGAVTRSHAADRNGVLGMDGLQVSEMSVARPAPLAASPIFDAAAVHGKFKAFGDTAPANTQIALRTNFDALAAFAPSVRTDATGTARVPITLPDNLTRYRIVVVAVAGAKQIGHGEAALTARLPLMARPSAPRFLNYGDRFDLPIVLQNQTDDPMTVEVAVRGTNLALPQAHGLRVEVKANDRIEVRFPAQAVKPGIARFQVAATSGTRADSAELSLPVWTPATTEAFATCGTIDTGAIVQPVQVPGAVVPDFGGLEVTTSSTALQELTDAMIYLQEYPYGCAEQLASRVLATAALKDVLTAFKAAEMPKPGEINAAMGRDLARLAEMQNDDGGFGFWTRYTRPYPYLGVHVAHALVLAKAKGFTVPPALYNRSMGYIKDIGSKFDADYDPRTRRMIRAYALYIRHLAGDTDTIAAKTLLGEASLDDQGPETMGWLLNVLAGDPAMASARTWLSNHATETAGAAHFTFSYGDHAYLVLGSNRRADAIVLDALIADQPKSDLIPKLVRGLLDGRVRGHWSGTQEDAFSLLALDRYFRTYESVTPDFVARLWLGRSSAGEGRFRGRTTDRVATAIPMAYLAQTPGRQNLTISKEGAGRLYYRVGMCYAPKDLNLRPADYGFTVKRIYEAVEKPSDVRREADGTWVVRAGAKVRVRVTMIATTRRYHVALTDPLPAGFEALNSELQGTETVARDTPTNDGTSKRYPFNWRWGHWWEHENLRDERAEAFTALLWEGAYDYVYICRATTPGQFVVPPAKAEEMYAPETFGRSGTDRVRVE